MKRGPKPKYTEEERKKRVVEQARNWQKRNPEKVKVYRTSDEYRKKARDARKIFYYQNHEKELNYSRKYHKENKEKEKEYRIENKIKIRTYFRKYEKERYYNDPKFKIRLNLRKRLNKSLKNKSKKSLSIKTLINCSLEELKIHLERQFQEGMSWENYGKWHIDHIKPCSSFDLTDLEQQKQCFNYTNLQPLWATDNIRKSNKYNIIEIGI